MFFNRNKKTHLNYWSFLNFVSNLGLIRLISETQKYKWSPIITTITIIIYILIA